MRRRWPAISLIGALILVVSACGNDDGAEPSPTSTPAPTPVVAISRSPAPTATEVLDELTYVGTDDNIWIVAADGLGDRLLVVDPCGDLATPLITYMEWSSTGQHLAFVCTSHDVLRDRVVVATADGDIVQSVEAAAFRWSPDGSRIAVEQTLVAGTRAARVRVLPVPQGEESVLTDSGVLLHWLGNDGLLVGLNVVEGEYGVDFDPFLFPVPVGDAAPFDGFAYTREFWPAPDGRTAIILGDYVEDLLGFEMSVYDIPSGSRTEILNSAIGYGSEHIPDSLLAFSPDSSRIFWINGNIYEDPPLFTADLSESSPAADVVGAGDLLGVVSPNGLVAWFDLRSDLGYSDSAPVVVYNPAEGTSAPVVDAASAITLAWRSRS